MSRNVKDRFIFRKAKRRKILGSILLLLLLGIPGLIFLNQCQHIDENFFITKTITGEVADFERFIEKIDHFDYNAELNVSWNNNPHKIANYCTSSVVEKYSKIVHDNREMLWWKLNHLNYVEYHVNVAMFNSLQVFSITDRSAGDYKIIDLHFEAGNETLGIYEDFQYLLEHPHWFLNESYFPGFFGNQSENLFSKVFLISIEFRYGIKKGLGTMSEGRLDQQILLSEDLEVMWVFVYNIDRIVE